MANPARDFQESQIFPGSVIRGLNRPAFSILIVLLLESLTGHIRGSQARYYNRDKFGSGETRLSEFHGYYRRKKVGFPDFLENIESDLPFPNRSKSHEFGTYCMMYW